MKILFVDKVMGRACEGSPRGVELFNVNLLQELAACGLDVTALMHPSWQSYVRQRTGLQVLPPKSARRRELSLFSVLSLLRGKHYDVLLLGNVANRLAGLVVLLRWLRICDQCVVIAHREPSRRVLWAQKAWPSSVILGVNTVIAQHFLDAGFPHTFVYYGVTHADRFLHCQPDRQDDQIDFCVVGNLDNAWKGSDTAVAAFRLLPDAIRERCHLHLASFLSDFACPDKNIHCYGWQPADTMPAFLAGMDVMIVPSRDEHVMRETFSQVMVQGMLAALPIITTRLPILTEKLDEGGGLVCDTVADMARAMEELAQDPVRRERLGREARATARKRYIWDTVGFVREYLALAYATSGRQDLPATHVKKM